MKKHLFYATAVSLAALLLSGCGAEPKPAEPTFECTIDNTRAPEWACGNYGDMPGMVVAVGTAKMSKMGPGFSRREAMANGRSNLAQQIQTLVKDKVETFARSTGAGADEVADKVSTQVSKQVAKVSLSGSKQLKYWQHPANKDIYLLMGVSEKGINQNARDSIKSSYKNEAALWQQFQSEKAQASLDKEFPVN